MPFDRHVLVSVAVVCLSFGTGYSGGSAQEAPPELFFVRGYMSDGDPCKLTGETPATSEFLDHTADLVSCPTGSAEQKAVAEIAGARSVERIGGYTLYSVPRTSPSE